MFQVLSFFCRFIKKIFASKKIGSFMLERKAGQSVLEINFVGIKPVLN